MISEYLLAIFLDGEYRVAERGKDGYPSIAGVGTLLFLRALTKPALAKFKQHVREANDASVGDPPRMGWSALVLLRHAKKPLWFREIAFAADPACRWAYVIDLDEGTFGVYKGPNIIPLDPNNERFAYLERPEENGGFFPVKHVHTWRFNALPKVQQFLKAVGE